MKSILFVLPHMLCGGVEKSLLSLLSEIPKDQYRITVYFETADGEFLPMLPAKYYGGELKLSPEVRADLAMGARKSLKYRLKHFQIRKLFILAGKLLRRDPIAALPVPFESLEELPGQYDIAVCYQLHATFIVRYVLDKVNAKRKVIWIHNESIKSGFPLKRLIPWLARYDHIFTVSKQLYEEFLQLTPQFRDKTSVAVNIVSEREIRGALDSKDVLEYPKDGTLKVLTVGRLDTMKGYDAAIRVCAKLKERGTRFQWFAMGSGSEENLMRTMIAELHLEDTFMMLGTKLNPYPYIDQCDIYVQPSRHEGYGIAVAEARMLCKPILCTDFAGARDQIINRKTGGIVPFEEEALTEALSELMEKPELREMYAQNLREENARAGQNGIRDEVRRILEYLDADYGKNTDHDIQADITAAACD